MRRPALRTTAAVLLAGLLAGACSDDAPTKATDRPSSSTAPDATASTSDGGDADGATDGPSATPAFEEPDEPFGLGSSRDMPLQVGGTTLVGDEWRVRLVGYDPDATEEVLEFNSANEPPPEGRVMALARIEATFVGEGRANAFLELEWALVDDAGELWTDQECGVLPDDLASQDGVPSGQTANGTICFAVPEDLLDQVVLYIAPLLGEPSTRRWWSAPTAGAGIVLETDGDDPADQPDEADDGA